MTTEHKAKILLVDDDADFSDMNRAVLEKNGYAVMLAYNGMECLEKVKADKPDLIVLDVMMSSPTEGFHVSYDLHNSPETRDIPVLMVTSVNESVPYAFEPDKNWLPVDAFIEKPLAPERLLAEVSKRLKKKSKGAKAATSK